MSSALWTHTWETRSVQRTVALLPSGQVRAAAPEPCGALLALHCHHHHAPTNNTIESSAGAGGYLNLVRGCLPELARTPVVSLWQVPIKEMLGAGRAQGHIVLTQRVSKGFLAHWFRRVATSGLQEPLHP